MSDPDRFHDVNVIQCGFCFTDLASFYRKVITKLKKPSQVIKKAELDVWSTVPGGGEPIPQPNGHQ